MPVAHFHLPRGILDSGRKHSLLIESSKAYSTILQSPIDRVRIFVVEYDPASILVAGKTVEEGGSIAPYFTAIVLAGRPASQRRELMCAFTDLLVDALEVERSMVRGRIIEVPPENWSIAGAPAIDVRSKEISEREAREAVDG